MKLKIEKLYRSSKDKQGNPLKTSDGRAYERVAIKCFGYGEGKWISGFSADWNKGWREGDEVEVEVEQRGEYLNFKKADKVSGLENRLQELEDAVFALEKRITGIEMNMEKPKPIPDDFIPIVQDENDIDPKDIPF